MLQTQRHSEPHTKQRTKEGGLGAPQGGRSPSGPERSTPLTLGTGTCPRHFRTDVSSPCVTGTRPGPHVSLSLTEFRREGQGRARLRVEPALSGRRLDLQLGLTWQALGSRGQRTWRERVQWPRPDSHGLSRARRSDPVCHGDEAVCLKQRSVSSRTFSTPRLRRIPTTEA